ncbi:efflux RND transporter periplasmic adaptor subunit [Sphingobium sufflavum]|uniref:efflux RND transporter periplasmic adaptor subunit n=1 Tax=Sphingobium sufflavum TaxID=1129547 RepID=UPI001F393FBD|nr:efflux RND transporter periplasmic adaptor subunit [Sphingobium sufflavum]MCE7795403.1 efflux RND transporter periplasmic adaptor subunit [Sphingobium sufflavum]
MSDIATLPPGKTLPRKQQIRLLAIAAGIAVLLYALIALVSWLMQPVPPVEEKTPAGAFRPTTEQRRQLGTQVIGTGLDPNAVQATGLIAVNGDHSTPVLLPVSGQIGEVYVQAGQHVAQGQPLFSIRSTDFVEARNAMLAAAAQRATAAAQLQTAQQNATRQQAIFQTAGGAEKDYRQAQADLIAAQSGMRAADAAAAASRDRLAILGNPAGGASMTSVYRSPVSGTIASRDVAPGQYVTAGGSAPLMTISDLSRVWLVAQVAENDAPNVRVGDTVQVTTPAWPGRVFSATIDNVAPELDAVTHRLPVRATVANPDLALKPQMFASFSIRRRTAGSALLVPSTAVIHEGDSARVWVVGRKGLLWTRLVTVGDSANGYDTIVSGLKPGERIVTTGAIFVNEAGLGA